MGEERPEAGHSKQKQKQPPTKDAVCIAAILKDEDAFVEEWVAYHRLLGVDHFYLYDNDPRQPLKRLLARHRDYVTVYPWLIGHDDHRYPGRTKQLKAYTHCLNNDAPRYDWVAFIDGDEFIALQESPDLKTFLAGFSDCDSIALNWHVFGHNGHYEDPPGLVIECLTRRMKEPRAMAKCISRPGVIASLESPHLYKLKAGGRRFDANKRSYADALYRGKTRLARINHYQCRSFMHWMGKPSRGEVGAFPDDPNQAWRFSDEGCLRQFVTGIAVNKNEYVDTSLVRYADLVKSYLSQLSESDNSSKQQHESAESISLRLRLKRGIRHTRIFVRLLISDLPHGAGFVRSLLMGELDRARTMIWSRRLRNMCVYLKTASEANDRWELAGRWRQVLDHVSDNRFALACFALCQAYEQDLEAVDSVTLERVASHPNDTGVAMLSAYIATVRNRWSDAETRWHTVLDQMTGRAPADVYLQAGTAYQLQGKVEEAELVLCRGLASHPENSRLAARVAKISAQTNHLDPIPHWESILQKLKDKAPRKIFLRLGRAYCEQGDFDRAQDIIRRGIAARPDDTALLCQLITIGQARQDGRQVLEATSTAMKVIEADPHAIDDGDLMTVCNGIMQCHGGERLLATLKSLRRHRGDSRLLSSFEGLAYLRSSHMELARRHWVGFFQRLEEDRAFAGERAAMLPHWTATADNLFGVATRREEQHPDSSDLPFCVYTALFGDYDELQPPTHVPEGLKFICFSDRPRNVPGWEVRVVEADPQTPAMNNRRIKLLPFEHLSEYDYSLYVDANLVLLGDPSVLYHEWLKGRPFVAWRHPDRSGVLDELEAILVIGRCAPHGIVEQYRFFREHEVPDNTGLVEASFLWRHHRDARVRKLMEEWWNFLVEFGSHRDQPTLGYLMWKTGVRPQILPSYLGTSRDNDFFYRLPHKQAAPQSNSGELTTRSKAAAVRVNGRRHGMVSVSSPAIVRAKPACLTWMCRSAHRHSASTVMRGEQLSEMAKVLADVKIGYVDESELSTQRNSILILTKGFLKDTTLDELSQLKDRGNILCADPVDDPLRKGFHECVDVYIAASMTQFIHFAKSYPDKIVHLITHHADPRLSAIRSDKNHCRFGYFGEPANVRYANELQGKVDVCITPTKRADVTWIPRLRDYNVHYAVRQRRAFDGFKPFLKGFTAAQCRSNIIVSLHEGDSRYYLTSDYPFMLKDESLESVLKMIEHAEASFGGSEWQRGLDIMKSVRRRCGPAQIVGELRALLDRCR